jgi:hypothetical protein
MAMQLSSPQLGFAEVPTRHAREHLMFAQGYAKGQRVPQSLVRSLADRILFHRLQWVLALATPLHRCSIKVAMHWPSVSIEDTMDFTIIAEKYTRITNEEKSMQVHGNIKIMTKS